MPAWPQADGDVLLVEDDVDDAFAFRRALRAMYPRMHVCHAYDWDAARRLVERRGANSFRAVFVDLKLAAERGAEVLDRIDRHPALETTRLFVLSASVPTVSVYTTSRGRRVLMLPKPITATLIALAAVTDPNRTDAVGV